jgi:hypothetical protein
MSAGFGELSTRLADLAVELPKSSAVGVTKATVLLVGAVTAAAGRYAGRPIARVRARQTPGIPIATVFMSSRKAHLLDHDTAAVSRSGGATILPGAVTGVRGQKLALAGASFGPVASSRKGVTHGDFMWERGVATALPLMTGAVAESTTAALLKAFHG